MSCSGRGASRAVVENFFRYGPAFHQQKTRMRANGGGQYNDTGVTNHEEHRDKLSWQTLACWRNTAFAETEIKLWHGIGRWPLGEAVK